MGVPVVSGLTPGQALLVGLIPAVVGALGLLLGTFLERKSTAAEGARSRDHALQLAQQDRLFAARWRAIADLTAADTALIHRSLLQRAATREPPAPDDLELLVRQAAWLFEDAAMDRAADHLVNLIRDVASEPERFAADQTWAAWFHEQFHEGVLDLLERARVVLAASG